MAAKAGRIGRRGIAGAVATAVLAAAAGTAAPAWAQRDADEAAGEGGREAIRFDRPARYDNLLNRVTWGGYYELEYEDRQHHGAGQDGIGEFDQHRLIFFAGVQPHERIRMFSELEFEHGADPDDLKFEQAWLEFALVPDWNLNLRGGVDLIPVGRLNQNHDGNLRDFIFRPEVDERLIPTTWYEAGAWLNGTLFEDRVTYQVGMSNGLREASSGLGGVSEIRNMRRTTELSEGDNNDNKAVSARVAVRPWTGTEFGVSTYNAKYATEAQQDVTAHNDEITFLAFDGHVIWRAWEIKGEWVNVDKDPEQNSVLALTGADGGYVEVAYHFFPEFMRDWFFASGFDDPTFTVMTRAEWLDFDNPTDEDRNDRKYYSFGLNYRPIEQMAFKVTYDVEDKEDRDNPATMDSNRFGVGMVLGF